MHESRAILLIITNIALGLSVVALVAVLGSGWLWGKITQWRRRRAVDRELDRYEERLFGVHRK